MHRIPARHTASADMTQTSSSSADDEAVWNKWEIQSLILLSLSLQVFLFLMAGWRRHSTSRALRGFVWLAYLLADIVAVFVLGHLAGHAKEPRHQLVSFWAPFVLVHLGGQDTITAFSKQDSELWTRHLLSLLTQVAVAWYVVATASWPDRRMRSAMVVLFIPGCIKYAERTVCLFISSPATLSWFFRLKLSNTLWELQKRKNQNAGRDKQAYFYMDNRLDLIVTSADRRYVFLRAKFNVLSGGRTGDWMSLAALFVDATPPNREQSILAEDRLPDLLGEKFPSSHPDCYNNAYEFVAEYTACCYDNLYTKDWLRQLTYRTYIALCDDIRLEELLVFLCLVSPILLYSLFQLVSTSIALVLYTVAQKGDQLHTSRADITVSYILLAGAIALDVSSAAMFYLSKFKSSDPWRRKQWSKKLGQYSMIKRHMVKDSIWSEIRQWIVGQYSMIKRHMVKEAHDQEAHGERGTSDSIRSEIHGERGTSGSTWSEIRQWIGRRLAGLGVDWFELTHTPITEPIKDFILKTLLLHGKEKQWHVASTRGLLAVQNWKDSRQDLASKTTAEELETTIKNLEDFPTSVLIWHLATDICYYYDASGDAANSSNNNNSEVTDNKTVSRQISNYIMYLVFKCGVKLTPNSQHLHDNAHDEIEDIIGLVGEKEAFMKIYEAKKMKEEEQHHRKYDERAQQKGKYPSESAPSDTVADSHVRKLLQNAHAVDSPVLPRACELAQRLIGIHGDTNRWHLIAKVWAEMLYYVAPRCGGAFHYEHLSTGGEFATHVLVLMRELGPFMPAPDVGY